MIQESQYCQVRRSTLKHYSANTALSSSMGGKNAWPNAFRLQVAHALLVYTHLGLTSHPAHPKIF